MKKFFTISTAFAVCLSINADSLKILSLGLGVPGIDEPQLMGLGLSPNAKFVCGAIEQGEGYFIYDLETDICKYETTTDEEGAALYHVDNNGLAIGYNGPGVTYSFEGVETQLKTPEGEDYTYVLGEDLSNDGSVMVGEIIGKGFNNYAAFSKDGGEWTLLPRPSDELLGYFAERGTTAKYVSGDGKVILGQICDNVGPATLWVMNDAGEYEVVPLFDKYVIMPDEDMANGEKPLSGLVPYNVSDNGKYALCRGTVMTEDGYKLVPVVYDVENQSIKIYDEPQEVDEYGLGLTPTAIADDSTFIGSIGTPIFGCTGSFIMKAGETQATLYVDAFPKYAETFVFWDENGMNVPTGISADGRYIMGYSFYSVDAYDPEEPAYFVTYVIDRNEGSAVEETDAVTLPNAIYSIDGQKISSVKKGINIVRMSDGSVRKIFKK